MKKNILLTSAVALLGIATLSACGGSANDPYANLDFTEPISGAKITMWTPFGSDMHAQTEVLVERWAEITGVEVEIEAKSGYDTLKEAVYESASNKSYPNITFAYPDHMATYVGSDIILRLDDYFAKGGQTKYEYASDEPSFKVSDFYEDYMRENQSIEYKDDGSGYTLGVPFNKSTEVLTYNKTFFDWAAGEDPSIVVPATWDEVEVIGGKILALLARRGVYGKYLGKDNVVYASQEECRAGSGDDELFDFSKVIDPSKADTTNIVNSFRPLGRDSMSNFFISTVRQWGGQYTGKDKATLEGKILFGTQVVKDAMKDMQDLYNDYIYGIPATWNEAKYCSNPFSTLKCVMTIGSSAGADSNAPSGGKFKVSCAPILYKSADKKYVISQGTNLVLLDKGTNKERVASWELLKFLTKYANGEFSAATGYFPACEYAFNSEDYQEFFSYKPKSMTDEINLAAAKVNVDQYMKASENWTKFVDEAFDGSSSVRTRIESAFKLLTIGLNGSQTGPEKVIDDLIADLGEDFHIGE